MADYAYDVFISYRRTKQVRQWVTKFFVKEFEAWLHETAGKAPRVFWDEKALGAGDETSPALQDALLRSKCLVAVLSPSYFRESRWCVSEFRTFRARSERLGLQVPGLVIPALWYGRDKFPPDAAALQMAPFEPFATMNAPTKRFREEVKRFAERVYQVMVGAPPYDPTFEFIWSEPVNDPIEQRTLSRAVA